MTPTPRTDAIAHRGYGPTAYIAELTGLARPLERELAELRKNTSELIASLQTETDSVERELAAERALLARLDGSCQTPIAGLAVLQDGQIWLRGEILRPDGSRVIAQDIRGAQADGKALGAALAGAIRSRSVVPAASPYSTPTAAAAARQRQRQQHKRLDAAALQSLLSSANQDRFPADARRKAAAELGVPSAAVDAFVEACEVAVMEGDDEEAAAVEAERGEKPKRDFRL